MSETRVLGLVSWIPDVEGAGERFVKVEHNPLAGPTEEDQYFVEPATGEEHDTIYDLDAFEASFGQSAPHLVRKVRAALEKGLERDITRAKRTRDQVKKGLRIPNRLLNKAMRIRHLRHEGHE